MLASKLRFRELSQSTARVALFFFLMNMIIPSSSYAVLGGRYLRRTAKFLPALATLTTPFYSWEVRQTRRIKPVSVGLPASIKSSPAISGPSNKTGKFVGVVLKATEMRSVPTQDTSYDFRNGAVMHSDPAQYRVIGGIEYDIDPSDLDTPLSPGQTITINSQYERDGNTFLTADVEDGTLYFTLRGTNLDPVALTDFAPLFLSPTDWYAKAGEMQSAFGDYTDSVCSYRLASANYHSDGNFTAATLNETLARIFELAVPAEFQLMALSEMNSGMEAEIAATEGKAIAALEAAAVAADNELEAAMTRDHDQGLVVEALRNGAIQIQAGIQRVRGAAAMSRDRVPPQRLQ